jgi:hypothetical protein
MVRTSAIFVVTPSSPPPSPPSPSPSPSPTLQPPPPPPTGPPDILRISNHTDDAFDSKILSECAAVGWPDPMLIKAQIHLESSFDPRAISDDTPCGIEPGWTSIESRSHGLFQMTPACGAQENDMGVYPAGHPKDQTYDDKINQLLN